MELKDSIERVHQLYKSCTDPVIKLWVTKILTGQINREGRIIEDTRPGTNK